MLIRTATQLDTDSVREINLLAFPDSENQLVARLATDLLALASTPPTLSFVAELDNQVVGHIAFSPVSMSHNRDGLAYILGPLSVRPGYQRRQIGTRLVRHGMQQLSEMEVNLLFVYGDPDYYGRFSFNGESATPYKPPYKLQYPFGWLVTRLRQETRIQTPASISCVEPLMNPDLW